MGDRVEVLTLMKIDRRSQGLVDVSSGCHFAYRMIQSEKFSAPIASKIFLAI
jgi:hypothetical protein